MSTISNNVTGCVLFDTSFLQLIIMINNEIEGGLLLKLEERDANYCFFELNFYSLDENIIVSIR